MRRLPCRRPSGRPGRVRSRRPQRRFDNVGDVLLENAFDRLALHTRTALRGSVSSGCTVAGYGAGPANYMQPAFRRAQLEGFIFFDHQRHFPEALSRLAGWVDAGELRWAEDVVGGLHNGPAALRRLFDGANLGPQLVRVGASGSSTG